MASSDTPQHFICPITLEVMKDPVIDNEGVSYERKAITEWLSHGNQFSPATNKVLTISDLRPNRALREAIEKHLGIETTVETSALSESTEEPAGVHLLINQGNKIISYSTRSCETEGVTNLQPRVRGLRWTWDCRRNTTALT